MDVVFGWLTVICVHHDFTWWSNWLEQAQRDAHERHVSSRECRYTVFLEPFREHISEEYVMFSASGARRSTTVNSISSVEWSTKAVSRQIAHQIPL